MEMQRGLARALAIGAFLVAVPPQLIAQPEFDFSFRLPQPIVGEPGETVAFEVVARIETRGFRLEDEGEPEPEGAGGWSLSIAADGCTIDGCTTEGTWSDCALDGIPRSGCFSACNVVSSAEVPSGAILGVALNAGQDAARTLRPVESPHDVLVLRVETTIPSDGSCRICTLRFVDGLREGPGRPIILNEVTVGQKAHRPTLGEITIVPSTPTSCAGPAPVVLSERAHRFPQTRLSACSNSACFSFTAPLGRPVLLELSDPNARHQNCLFARWGSEPTPAAFDHIACESGRASQRLVIPAARSETCYVLVRSALAAHETADIQLRGVVDDLSLERIRPIVGVVDQRASAVILGAGFAADVTRFFLASAGDPRDRIPASETTIVSGDRAEVVFDLVGRTPGSYHLDAEGEADPARLEEAFRIVSPEECVGLAVDVVGHPLYGFNRLSRTTLRFANARDSERPAPLFKLVAPETVEIRLARERTFRGHDTLAMGINPDGFAGVLPVGTEYRLPVEFRRPCEPCPGRRESLPVDIFVFVPCFDPDASPCPPAVGGLPDCPENRIHWDTLPSPDETIEDWESLRPELAAEFGDSWSAYHERLAEIATRLARRGVEGASVQECFAFAVRKARGLPSAAATGSVRSADTGAPIAAATVVALIEGTRMVVSSATTDEEGAFAVDCLDHGEPYTFAVADHVGDEHTERVPPGSDVYGVRLDVTPGANAFDIVPSPCEGAAAPGRPPFPPEALFRHVETWNSAFVGPRDPNDKPRQPGEGGLGFFGLDTEIEYTVTFQNVSDESPATTVVITDLLDEDLDCSQLVFLEVEFGKDHIVHLDAQGRDLSSGNHRGELSGIDLPPRGSPGVFTEAVGREPIGLDRRGEKHLFVDIRATCEPESRTLRWVLDTRDSAGNQPDDIRDGFLKERMEGSVSFRVRTQPDLPGEDKDEEDVDFGNGAVIQFDSERPIATKTIRNGFSLFGAAETPQMPNPPDEEPDVPVDVRLSWESATNAYIYDIFIWRQDDVLPDGELLPDAPANDRLVFATSFTPGPLELGTEYRWSVVARNKRDDPAPASGPWTFTTTEEGTFMRGNADNENGVNITDPVVTLSYLFLGGPAPQCFDAADSDDSGAVNITDPVFTLSFLFLGGSAPPLPGPLECGPDPTGDTLPDCRDAHCE